jgi:hypothetical protein
MNKLILLILLLLTHFSIQAQELNTDSGLATTMRSNGKIYVVVAVALTVMIGLIAYLVSVDRKITKLEKSLKK